MEERDTAREVGCWWLWGRWEWEAGLFQGFGVGFLFFGDELALTFACFGVSATRREAE